MSARTQLPYDPARIVDGPAKDAYCAALQRPPQIPWSVPVDRHLEILREWWLALLKAHFPWSKERKLKKQFLFGKTWHLIGLRKRHLSQIHRISRMRQCLETVVCFKAW
eukprot:674435-Alexandrium_andersonii.AAC.1